MSAWGGKLFVPWRCWTHTSDWCMASLNFQTSHVAIPGPRSAQPWIVYTSGYGGIYYPWHNRTRSQGRPICMISIMYSYHAGMQGLLLFQDKLLFYISSVSYLTAKGFVASLLYDTYIAIIWATVLCSDDYFIWIWFMGWCPKGSTEEAKPVERCFYSTL